MSNAWRFAFPSDEGGAAVGPYTDAAGRVALVTGAAAIRQALLLLLATMPGERVMRPEYGCEIHRLVFAPADDTTAGLAMHYVRQAVERWEPRVELQRVDALFHPDDPTRLDLILDYRVRTTGQDGRIDYALKLGGI
jgi:phage baseplate assembly protein W